MCVISLYSFICLPQNLNTIRNHRIQLVKCGEILHIPVIVSLFFLPPQRISVSVIELHRHRHCHRQTHTLFATYSFSLSCIQMCAVLCMFICHFFDSAVFFFVMHTAYRAGPWFCPMPSGWQICSFLCVSLYIGMKQSKFEVL